VTRFPFEPSQAAEFAWFWNDAGGKTHAVGEKRPNPWSLYDLHGNVWEWVWDWHDENAYATEARGDAVDPKGPPEGAGRVLRGGSWSNDLRYLRASHRNLHAPDYRDGTAGFRVLYLLEEPRPGEEAKAAEVRAASAPEAKPPESGLPKRPPPDWKMPELKAPEIKAPEIQIPEISVPRLPW
jgi:hypothetical protein